MSANTDKLEFEKFLEARASRGRTMLLPVLLEAQKKFGYISKEIAEIVGSILSVPVADIYGVIEFYSMLKSEPQTENRIGICMSPSCLANGSKELRVSLIDTISEINFDRGKYSIEDMPCLGLCDQAPAVLVNEKQIGKADVNKVLANELGSTINIYGDKKLITTRIQGCCNLDFEDFLSNGGLVGLKAAVDLSPEEIIDVVKRSGLKGRGGAGFPTGIKKEGAADAEGTPKYLVCNADESEPGTFKDRALMLGDPFSLIEGMVITAFVLGTNQGFLYIRGEYPDVHEIMQEAVLVSQSNGLLGKNILGTGFDFDLEIRSGAGAYICGEETALFESIEGKRGYPRVKPPFPTAYGLYGKPTIINNVETLVNIPLILRIGVEEFRKCGSRTEPGPRLFSVSGNVRKPGVYEVGRPITIRELVYNMAGGITGENEIRAILLGGAAGKFLPPDKIDLVLSDEEARQAGFSLGSGAIMVFDDSNDLLDILHSLAEFFAHESCGKCFPCQLGTQRQLEIVERYKNGEPIIGDYERLLDVGWTMTDASLCGLGQTAATAILSVMDHWPELFTKESSV